MPKHFYRGALVMLCLMGMSVAAVPRNAPQTTDQASHFNLGNELMMQERLPEAIEQFEQAILADPGHLPSHQALAVAYAMVENFPLAWEQVRLLRDANVALPEKFMQMLSKEMPEAEAVRRLDRLDAELADALTRGNKTPNDAAAQARLAEVLRDAGDYRAAKTAAERALQLEPGRPDASLVLARLLILDPRTRSDAIPPLRSYLEKVPRSTANTKDVADGYGLLYSILSAKGENVQALQLCEEALKAFPGDARFWNNAAWIYATATEPALRDPKKALAYATKAVELSDSKEASYLDTLAEAFYVNGDVGKAIDTEKRAQSIAPDNEFIVRQLQKFQRAESAQR